MGNLNHKYSNSSIAQLQSVASQIQVSLQAIFDTEQMSSLPTELDSQRQRLLCRAQEWNNSAFFVIVVGPVKSGKSTLVNLLAHEKVSPTNFLECTVRPSIIYRKKEGKEKSTITSFVTNEQHPSIELIDSIIDYIKGYEFANLQGVTVEEPCDLTPENLDMKVAYRIGLEFDNNSQVALTSIAAAGGDFLQKDVYLIDMPGFDGIAANIEDSFYEAVANRADLIVFVQSSNSAINKISEHFCNILQKRNSSAPLFFVHNIFDSAYWHTEEECQRVINEQVSKAREFFVEQNFLIHDDCFHGINLGKVSDARNEGFRTDTSRCRQGYEAMLNSADNEFQQIESRLHDLISAGQGKMRILNCINRTAIEMDVMHTKLHEICEQMQHKLTEYQDVESEYNDSIESLNSSIDNTQFYCSTFLANELSNSLFRVINDLKPDSGKKYLTKDVRNLANELIMAYRNTTKMYYSENFIPESVIKSISDKIFAEYAQRVPRGQEIGRQIICTIQPFSFDFSCINNQYDSEKQIPKLKLWYKRTGGEVYDILKRIQVLFVGTLQTPSGYIPNILLAELQTAINTWIDACVNTYLEAYIRLLEVSKQNKLSEKIPEIDKFKRDLKQYHDLAQKLDQILTNLR